MNDFFENTSIKLIENEVYASRKQLQDLYDIPASTLSRIIKELKDDPNLELQSTDIQEITKNSNNLKNRKIEYFNIDWIVNIGFRANSPIASKFQVWSRKIIIQKINELKEDLKQAQLMESIAWNHLDAKDNFR